MKKLMAFLFIGIFFVSLVGAEQEQTFQFNKEFDLKRGCSNAGFFCDSSFVCNITLIYPDGSLLKNNVIMGDFTSYRNVTINQTENNQLGFIKAIEVCNNGTWAGDETFNIVVTADGKKCQNFPIHFVVIIIGLVLMGTGAMIEKLKMFKSMGSMVIIIMGVITLFPGYSFINWTTLMGKAIGFGLLGMGFYFLINDAFSRNEQAENFEQKDNQGEDLFDTERGGEDDIEQS